MNRCIKQFITGMAIWIFAIPAYAQSNRITATLVDSNTKETLPFATVSITPANAKTPSKYTLSTNDGEVNLTEVRKGEYVLKVELMGYKTLLKKVKIEGGTLALGELEVEQDIQMLEAAKVTDVGNPITVKKDTIEYNATLYKSSDNDMLIDLLKKLPGIEVGSDGSITANGETIKKITIDGKTFFLDDPQLASKNIPSKIIEKVRVVEKKSDQALFTGIDDGEEETIIDLGVKKGMMKGWFGNFMAGGGHDIPSENNDMNDWRWQGAGFAGNFTDKSQISIILNGNNTNNRGFNDLASNMMGNMRGGGRGGFGRGGDVGITTSWMAGINGAWDLLDNRMNLGANYLYSGSNKNLLEVSDKITYKDAVNTLDYHKEGGNYTRTQGHRAGVRLDHKFSDNTSILFEPQFNYGYGDFVEESKFTTLENKAGMVNNGFNKNTGDNKNWTANGRLLLRQRLGKPGRTMTVNFNYNISNNRMDGYNQSINRVVDGDTTVVNQRFEQASDNYQLAAGLTYTEPLWRNWYFEANYNYTWRKQNSYKDTYDSGAFTIGEDWFDYNRDGEKYNSTFSNTIVNESHNHKAGADILFQKDKLRAQVGFNANPTTTLNTTNGKSYDSFVVKWSPQASFSYDFSDNNNLRLNYLGESSQPTTAQLMPVPDNSDPLNISLGNPYLLPYFTNTVRGMYRYTNKKSFTSVSAFLNAKIVNDPIITTNWYDDSGRQFSMPTNGPDSYNTNLRVMVNSPIAKSKFSVYSMTRLGYANSSNYVKTGSFDMTKYYKNNQFDYESFHQDFPDLGNSGGVFSTNTTQTLTASERIRFTFRCDLVELTAGGQFNLSKSWYTINSGNTNDIWTNMVDASMNWTIPGGVGLIADYSFNWYDGYTTPQPSKSILNVEITKLLFKNKFTLALKGYDLLGQSRNLSISDSANYHQETRNNSLGRYIILSLTYRFGNFNNAREKMDSQHEKMRNSGGMRGPGGIGGPGGMGGPPPGM